jgi:arylsulfatase A-like enzyme
MRSYFHNRAVIIAAALFAVINLSFPAVGAETTEKPAPALRLPNIVFILADDLGYGDLGCYRQTRIKTPNIDRLASEGMAFSDFYAGSTVCAPSRCALMTGLDTGHCRIRGNANVALQPGDVTMAEVLQGAGYYTGLIGKWGLGNEDTTGVPQKQGFQQFVGYLDQVHAHNYYTDYLWRYDPPSPGKEGYAGRLEFPENRDGKKGVYMDDFFTTAGMNFIKIVKPDVFNGYRPFFLYMAYTIPHANNEEYKISGNGMQVPSDIPYTDENWPQPEKNKAAMITRLDREVGKILDLLKSLNLADNTIVVFTSDNGPHKEAGTRPDFFKSSGVLRGIKRDMYEGGIRVPLIVRWPGHIKAGSIANEPFAFWDFLPTFAQIANAKVPGKIDGISMLPTLLGQTQTNHHDFLYWEFHERGFQQAVRMGNWKAVRLGPGQPLELYNLKTDMSEKENVAQAHPEVVKAIEDYLKTARTDSPDWPIKAAVVKTNAVPQKK